MESGQWTMDTRLGSNDDDNENCMFGSHLSLLTIRSIAVAPDLLLFQLAKGKSWISPFTLDPRLEVNSALWIPKPRRKFFPVSRSSTLEARRTWICPHTRFWRKPSLLDPLVSRSRPIRMLEDSQRITFWLSLLCTKSKYDACASEVLANSTLVQTKKSTYASGTNSFLLTLQ